MLLLKNKLITILKNGTLLLVGVCIFKPLHASTPHQMLVQAARKGSVSEAENALTLRANVDGPPRAILTPLAWAARNGHNDVVQLLINNEADLNATKPIYQAAWYGNADTMKILFDAGANFDTSKENSRQTLFKAANNRWDNVVRLLFSYGVIPPTESEMTKKGFPEDVKKMIRDNRYIFDNYVSTIKETLKEKPHGANIDKTILEELGLE